MLWMIKSESATKVGCIHTSEWLDVDYVGVIIGPDLVIRNGEVITDAFKRTYRTLMSRGMKGCYLYCADKETSAYFKSILS
jgi:DUF2075 family protein